MMFYGKIQENLELFHYFSDLLLDMLYLSIFIACKTLQILMILENQFFFLHEKEINN